MKHLAFPKSIKRTCSCVSEEVEVAEQAEWKEVLPLLRCAGVVVVLEVLVVESQSRGTAESTQLSIMTAT